jgi:hypothetical protein
MKAVRGKLCRRVLLVVVGLILTIAIVSVDLGIRQLNFDTPAESLVDGQVTADWIKCFQDVVDGIEDSTEP